METGERTGCQGLWEGGAGRATVGGGRGMGWRWEEGGWLLGAGGGACGVKGRVSGALGWAVWAVVETAGLTVGRWATPPGPPRPLCRRSSGAGQDRGGGGTLTREAPGTCAAGCGVVQHHPHTWPLCGYPTTPPCGLPPVPIHPGDEVAPQNSTAVHSLVVRAYPGHSYNPRPSTAPCSAIAKPSRPPYPLRAPQTANPAPHSRPPPMHAQRGAPSTHQVWERNGTADHRCRVDGANQRQGATSSPAEVPGDRCRK